MKWMRRALTASSWAGTLAFASAASAEPEQEPPSDGWLPTVASSSDAAPARDTFPEEEDADVAARRKHWGLMFDLGSMHGGMLSLAYRPAPWLRLHAGAGTNAVSPGYRAGFTLKMPGTGPALNIEAGHFLPGDMNGLLKILVGTGYRANSRLEDFDYDFVNLHAGWEVESGALTFFARGGATLLWTRLPALPEPGAEVAALGATEPFWLVLPSVSFGFVGFL
ncbi:MAG TPA: hypothetical protein VMG12_24920 [Polyangiaceae bacterium]|nr:hypothetical protein [Polyangiaceae bacterium]